MVNKRLLWFLDKHNLFSKEQSGFRKHRSTQDNLVLLQSHISVALNKKQEVIAATFDIDGAFDSVSRQSILNKLTSLNISGHIFHFIRNFLTSRTFKVFANGIFSSTCAQTDGVPQGSVISPTLFNLAINDICYDLLPPIKYALYADDLFIYCPGTSTPTTTNLIQSAVNTLSKNITRLGLTFSQTKSRIIKFSRRPSTLSPTILINNDRLPVVDHCKILSLTFDSRLTWKQHIREIKGECGKRLNLIKILSHYHWGADENSLIKIYSAIIRSKLDYGCHIYISATKSDLDLRNSVHNTALRLCLGAFRSSPAESIYCEANEPPLWIRRQQILLSYAASVSANPLNPVYSLFTSNSNTLHNSSALPLLKPIPLILSQLLDGVNLKQTSPLPIPSTPPWTINIPKFNTSLMRYNKHATPKQLIINDFNDIIMNNHIDLVLYTDASKNETGVGCSVTTSQIAIKSSLIPSTCNVHTGELFSILQAINSISPPYKLVAICTDSLASILSIQNIFTEHPIVQSIHDSYQLISSQGIAVTLIWIPSHIGIEGNELADKQAKIAATYTVTDNVIIGKDSKSQFKRKSRVTWQQHWDTINTSLRQIQRSIGNQPIIFAGLSRQDLTAIRRVRIGHSRLTHGYLMTTTARPFCSSCNSYLTMKHILTECRKYTVERQQFRLSQNYNEVLNNSEQITSLLQFLKDVQLYHQL
ncbi:uncharacterized protein LOC130452381 [Diorhabda sublineata]|uniref:uncharacterized protein LOC130452381 n=1 Tax=Diorhabda sublineata TaxID=1163346 RepID=UPI0024E158D1|nr:uncharacterized protein LOC130452381 [Diorhabda sublineata]